MSQWVCLTVSSRTALIIRTVVRDLEYINSSLLKLRVSSENGRARGRLPDHLPGPCAKWPQLRRSRTVRRIVSNYLRQSQKSTTVMTTPIETTSNDPPRVLLVGIGGPTCSGKTTLTKHLLNLITRNQSSTSPIKSFIIHQDDFAPPESTLVWNEKVQSADWDDPETSVLWDKLRKTIHHVKHTGTLPDDHSSHDELNPLPDLPIDDELLKTVEAKVSKTLQQMQSPPTHIVFVDGFLLYYDQVVRQQIDVPIFLRIGRSLLKERRDARGGYVTAEGDCWKDPPLYFDEILWPSHLKAHAHLFEDGNVENGPVLAGEGAKRLTVVEAQDPPGTGSPRKIDDIVAEGCQALLAALDKWQQ